jgi:hypothetical protein
MVRGGMKTSGRWRNILFTFRFERRQAATDVDKYPRKISLADRIRERKNTARRIFF